jgi:hypothetical protein
MFHPAFGIQPPATLCHAEARKPAVRKKLSVAPLPPTDTLYSARARRRMATYLRLRMLELRKAELTRAADVIERRLPVDSLLAPLP